jgi:hypothetical protein
LGKKQIEECLSFIDRGDKFVENIDELNDFSEYDNTLFDIISGLFQTNKVITIPSLPGSFVKGFLDGINELNFIERVL